MKGKTTITVLLGLLVTLVVYDGFLTNSLVRGGLAREGNPLLQSIVGDSGFIVLKVAGALLCAVILWDVHRKYPRVAIISTCCAIIFYSLVVLWNSSVFLMV